MNNAQVYNSIAPELADVERVLKTQLHRVCKDEEVVSLVFKSFFQSPGKKLRPSLVLLSAFALRSDNLRDPQHAALHESLVSIATVSELIHSASLMHDDVLDGSATRRGQASLNAQFGTKIAILAGDIIYSQTFELLLEHAHKDSVLLLIQCARRMCRGEIINLSEHDFETYKTIIADKTASLMTFCCKAGAEAVRQESDSSDVVDALERFGYNYGMMFQLVDDLEDHDSPIAMANKSKTLALLSEHIQAAEQALTIVPDSIYKAGLNALWRDVVLRAEKLTHTDASSNELAESGQSLLQVAASGGVTETEA